MILKAWLTRMRKSIGLIIGIETLTLSLLIFSLNVSANDVGECNNIFLEQDAVEIKTLTDFARAMTEGTRLNSNQDDLFELYRIGYFGNPQTQLGQKIGDLTRILKLHPELTKPSFREYYLERGNRVYDAPDELKEYIKNKNKLATTLKTNLLRPFDNLDFWKKLLSFTSGAKPKGLDKNQEKEWKAKENSSFSRYLSLLFGQKNRLYLSDVEQAIEPKLVMQFQMLTALLPLLEKRGLNTTLLRQTLVDLVAYSGFLNPSIQNLFKSKNGAENLGGLLKTHQHRDSLAMQLGFEQHFSGLMQSLRIGLVTGGSKDETESEILLRFEKVLRSARFVENGGKRDRVRSLSIQEAPFRSCLGGSDCSSRTYFDKALDPNYIYFTTTDAEHNSTGHVTLVLGEAKDSMNNSIKIAFIDKVQNVPNSHMINFLNAVSLSVGEKGYTLAIPRDLGAHNGISNDSSTTSYLQSIVNQLRISFTGFTQHPHRYTFQNAYSRADLKLEVLEWNVKSQESEVRIVAGDLHLPKFAPTNLKKEDLFQALLNLKASTKESDLIKYISSESAVSKLKQYGIHVDFVKDMQSIVNDHSLPFKARKLALFEILFKATDDNFLYALLFSDSEVSLIHGEIQQWRESSDPRKKLFLAKFEENLVSYLIKNKANRLPLMKLYINKSKELATSFMCKLVEKEKFQFALFTAKNFPVEVNGVLRGINKCSEPPIFLVYQSNSSNKSRTELSDLLMISENFDVDTRDSKNKDLYYYANLKNDSEMVRILVKKYDKLPAQVRRQKLLDVLKISFRKCDQETYSATVKLIGNLSPEEINSIIFEYADFNSIDTIMMMRTLMKSASFDPNAKVYHHHSISLTMYTIKLLALNRIQNSQSASSEQLFEILNFLLDHSAIDLSVTDKFNKTALDFANETKDKTLISLLKSKSTSGEQKPNKSILNRLLFWKRN